MNTALAPTTRRSACPICGAPATVERQRPYTVRSGQACDHRPGWVEVSTTCTCRDAIAEYGSAQGLERYDDRLSEQGGER